MYKRQEDGEASLRVGADGGCTLYGAIDRIDEWDAGNARYVRVLDYKRGSKPFSLAEAWAGLQLQLLVYLAAAAKKRGALGAGAFYFRMDDGYVLTQQTDPQAVAALRRDQLRMDGAALEDERAQQALSRQPKSFYRALAPMDRAQMDALLARSVEMASRHVDAIRAGEAAPAPVRVGKTIACGYCQWRGACMFDQNADRARVRRVAADKAAVKAALEGEHT